MQSSMSLTHEPASEMSDTKVYEPYIRARLGTAGGVALQGGLPRDARADGQHQGRAHPPAQVSLAAS